MATIYKVLGQTAGTASTSTYVTAYTVPTTATSGVIISSISVCNTSSTDYRFRIAIATTTSPGAANWIAYDATAAGLDTAFINAGLTMDTTNKYLIISSENAALSFTICGSEA